MSDKIRVLYYGDSPTAHTGFGKVAREVLLRLHETGRYDIICYGINYYGDPHDLEGILKIFPVTTQDMHGKHRMYSILEAVQPDVLFTLNDYDALNWLPQLVQQYTDKFNKRLPWVWYFPVDGEPFRSKYAQLMKSVVDYPITYTKWAQDTIKKTDSTLDIPFVYHGVDKNMFRPLSEDKKKDARKQLGINEDDFVILGIGVNQLRKQFSTLLELFEMFKRDKDDAVLYLHTQQVTHYGWDIPSICIDENIENKVYFTGGLHGPMGIPMNQMNYIYNIADIAVFPHVGEGFGLHQIESMAAGLPVIAHNVTATPEVVKDGGILIPTEKITDPLNPKKKIDLTMRFAFGDRGLKRPIVSASKMLAAMNDLYENPDKRKEIAEAGLNVVRNTPEFDWDNVANFFDEALTNAAKSDDTIGLELDEII